MTLTPSQRTAILRIYDMYIQSADHIISHPDLSAEFHARVCAELPEPERFSLARLNEILLNLRKLGAAKGGLPRKQRTYKGRVTH
jgi:hypothetical protein